MVTAREKQLEDEILRLRALVGEAPMPSGDEWVDAVFNNVVMGERPNQRGILIPTVIPQSPGLEVGRVYRINKKELAYPWWKRV